MENFEVEKDDNTSSHDDTKDSEITTPRICIIGAGVNGLCVTRHLIANQLCNITIFEATSRIGGLWVYDPDPNHRGALYRSLTTNIHRNSMHFPDLDFETECPTAYPPHGYILNYIEHFCRHFDLSQYVKFNHEVIKVTPPSISTLSPSSNSKQLVEDSNISSLPQWTVSYHDVQNETKQELFDVVIVCNGHFSKEYIPDIPGFSITKIPWIHSRSYREPRRDLFDDTVLVIVGGGYSARDISAEIVSQCNVYCIYHVDRGPLRRSSKDRYRWKRGIKRFSEHSVQFEDGVIIFPDLVIFCTGYDHHFPFLNHLEFTKHPLIDTKYGFRCNGRATNGLYQHVVFPSLPSIFFPGINHGVYPFVLAFYQSRWIAKIISDLKYIRNEKSRKMVWRSKYIPEYEAMVKWMRKHGQFRGDRKQHLLTNHAKYYNFLREQVQS